MDVEQTHFGAMRSHHQHADRYHYDPQCEPNHDKVALGLSIFLCIGLVVSYLPQHLRIILKRSSLGFSPWFLLLGATSAASSFLNVVALQWGLVRCCSHISSGSCAESMMGIVQVALQWIMFIVVLVLFMMYYPAELKYERAIALRGDERILGGARDDDSDTSVEDLDSLDSHIAANYAPPEAGASPTSAHDLASSSAFSRLVPTFWPVWKAVPGSRAGGRSGGARRRRTKRRTAEWSLAIALAWIVLIHFIFILAVTLLLATSLPSNAFPSPTDPSSPFPLPGGNVTILPAYPGSPLLGAVRRSFDLDFSALGDVETLGPSSRLLVERWAAFLGISSTLLAAGQYAPQIAHTWRAKLVGSLSIPMMCLQVPGSAIFVYSLAIRPGTDWSSLAAYVITGVLQLVLLVLCVAWRVRQRKLGVDDFGVPIPTACEPDARARGGARAHGHEHGWEEGPRALERAREEAREGEED